MRRDPHALAGAYALDAISDPDEAGRFARHLERCQACTREVRGLREVATALAFGAEQAEPPASMRAAVLAAVARTPQLPPAVPATGAAGSRRRARWLVTWGPRLVAVAAAVVAIVLGVQLSSTRDQLGRTRDQDRAIAAVLAAPDARVVTGPVTGGPVTGGPVTGGPVTGGSVTGGSVTGGGTSAAVVSAVVSAARHALVITTAGLPRLPGGKVYEMWLIGPSATRPAGLVSGPGGPLLAAGLAPGDRLAMTVERAGGASQPTTRPIALIPLF